MRGVPFAAAIIANGVTLVFIAVPVLLTEFSFADGAIFGRFSIARIIPLTAGAEVVFLVRMFLFIQKGVGMGML